MRQTPAECVSLHFGAKAPDGLGAAENRSCFVCQPLPEQRGGSSHLTAGRAASVASPSLTSLLLPTTDTQNVQKYGKPFITAPCAPCCEVFPPRNARGACPAPQALPPAQGCAVPRALLHAGGACTLLSSRARWQPARVRELLSTGATASRQLSLLSVRGEQIPQHIGLEIQPRSEELQCQEPQRGQSHL